MTTSLEVSANAVNALSILLAARNSAHTWWVGITGCVLFAVLFFFSRLYADVLLQSFFIVTSARGWWQWSASSPHGDGLPITSASWRSLFVVIAIAIMAASGYGYLLWRFTDAFAPFLDSLILTLSVAAQLLLMNRKYESWWLWLAVNVLSVTLFSVRGLWITAALYAAFGVNAVAALFRWRRLMALS